MYTTNYQFHRDMGPTPQALQFSIYRLWFGYAGDHYNRATTLRQAAEDSTDMAYNGYFISIQYQCDSPIVKQHFKPLSYVAHTNRAAILASPSSARSSNYRKPPGQSASHRNPLLGILMHLSRGLPQAFPITWFMNPMIKNGDTVTYRSW